MGPGILPATTVSKHNQPCHLQMPTKAQSCKKEAICEHGPEAPSCPVGQGSFKMDCLKVEKCSMVRESKFDIIVGNHGRRVLRAKEEGDLPACYQRSVQKPASLMVWGCISAYGMGSLHVLEGIMNAERFRAKYAPPKTPKTLQQLETYIRQEWDQIPTPKLQKLINSMPRRLQTVLKRRGDTTPW